jgi:hypothetical protein
MINTKTNSLKELSLVFATSIRQLNKSFKVKRLALVANLSLYYAIIFSS